jgi:hypothetical protein
VVDSRRRQFPAVLVSLVVAALLGTAVASSAASQGALPPAAAERDINTGLVASVLAAPRPVLEADGRQHLVYEPQLSNPVEVAITIDKVEALDAASNQVLGALEGDAVAAAIDVLPLAGEPTAASSYQFYGADVLSVAAGVVVRVKDGIPDNTPVGSLPPDLTFETVPGTTWWSTSAGATSPPTAICSRAA